MPSFRDQMDDFYALLGRYIGKTTEIEARMNIVIAAYFDVPGIHYDAFSRWVLGNMEFSKKLEVLRRIVEDLDDHREDLDPAEFRSLVKGLQRMMERRNLLAHSHHRPTVGVTYNGVRTEGGIKYPNRKAPRESPDRLITVNPDDLRAELEALDDLMRPLRRLGTIAFEQWEAIEIIDGVDTSVDGTRGPQTRY